MNEEKDKVKKEKRISYIDIARGISIIFMIVGHLGLGYNAGTRIIYSFHMPLFIIVSGMFFKEDENIKELLTKIIKKLLLPYIITAVFTNIISCLIQAEQLNIINMIKQILVAHSNFGTFFTSIQSIGVLWFIPFLVITKMLYFTINKICKDDMQKGILCGIATISGVLLATNKIYLPWSFDIALASMIFYHIGYILKKYDYLEKIPDNKILILFALILWCIGAQYSNIELAVRKYSIIGYILAICGTIIVIKISKIIENFPLYIPEILKWYGRNSMLIICFHHLELNVIPYYLLGICTALQLFIAKIVIITILTILMNIIEVLRKEVKIRKSNVISESSV